MNKKKFMLAFMPNITNKLRILLKFPRTPRNNKNAADRGQGPPNSTSSEIDDIEWFRKKMKCYVWFENERRFVNTLKD